MLCLTKSTRSLFAILAVTSIGTALNGCASGGIQTTAGQPIQDIFPAFLSGDARLHCGVSCSGAWGASRRKSKSLYENSLWKDLALGVAEVGFESDLTYFYLGRAAEGLGYMISARGYYRLALSGVHKCAGIFNNCDGWVFPRDIRTRLDALDAQVAKEAAEKSAKLAAEREKRQEAERAAKQEAEQRTKEAAEREKRQEAERAAREAAAEGTVKKSTAKTNREATVKSTRESAEKVSKESDANPDGKAMPDKSVSENGADINDSSAKSADAPKEPPPIRVRSVLDL